MAARAGAPKAVGAAVHVEPSASAAEDQLDGVQAEYWSISVPLAVKTATKPAKARRAGFAGALVVVSESTTHAAPWVDVAAKATELVPPASATVPLQLDASLFEPSTL